MLLVGHGIVTLAASVVLAVQPSLIPSIVGAHLDPSANILAYLLAGAEFGICVFSFGGSRLSDPKALRLVASSCIAFHASSAALEVYAYVQGMGGAILLNVAARVIVIALLAGLSRNRL